MKTKTAWKITIADSQGSMTEDYLLTAATGDVAARRAVEIARKKGRDYWVGSPYAQSVSCRGEIFIFS